MPQFAETITVSVTQDEIAAIIRDKIAEQFGAAADQIDIVNFRMNSSITFHKQLEVTDRDFEIQPRNFVVTITKPLIEKQAEVPAETPAAASGDQQQP